MFDVGVMVAFGLVGYFMRRFDYNPAAFIIAFVLAKGAEESFRQALILTDDGVLIFLQRPIALVFIVIGISVLAGRAIVTTKKTRRK